MRYETHTMRTTKRVSLLVSDPCPAKHLPDTYPLNYGDSRSFIARQNLAICDTQLDMTITVELMMAFKTV